MDICHLKNAQLEPTFHKYKGPVVLRARWHCKRRLWSLCSLCWTGLVCVSNDSSKSDGCHGKTTRLWWTSSWCRISTHSGENGGCSQIAQNSEVRMSWYMDTSSTTLVAEDMVKHWRSRGSSWAKFVLTPTCRPLVGKTIWESSIGLRWDNVSNWECPFVQRKQGLFFSVYVDDKKWLGRKQNKTPMWKKLMKLVDLEEPTSFLDHVYLGCTQNECKSNETIIEEYRQKFESRISAGCTKKLLVWENPHAKTVASPYDTEGHAQKMRWRNIANWRTTRQSSRTKSQVLTWMITVSRKRN